MADINVNANVQRISTLGKVRILVEQVVGSPSQAQINTAVASYIDSHPGALSPLSQATKSAMLDIAAHVAYIDANGQSYYDALDAALNAKALLSITAVYTQTGTVYDTDSLDSLKSDLVVTANYDDGTTADVTSACTLSGTLAEGTSTVTVTYQEKTATFNVTVTHYALEYITDGLIHRWDAINNTGDGHDSTATVWKDLVGNVDLTKYLDGDWTDDALDFPDTTSTTSKRSWTSSNAITDSTNMTIEVCLEPYGRIGAVAWFTGYSTNKNKMIGVLSADVSVIGYANVSGNGCATTGFSSLTEVKSIVATYTNTTQVDTYYVNGVAKTKNCAHTYGRSQVTNVVIGGYGSVGSGNSYPYSGKIHAIRVYNRVLTANEIAQNYAVDVARFGLES